VPAEISFPVPGAGSEIGAVPRDPEHDDDADALYPAGQLPCDDGEWLLVTELHGLPGAAFTVPHLPPDAWHAHGGGVLVRLLPDTSSAAQPAVRAEVRAALGGHLTARHPGPCTAGAGAWCMARRVPGRPGRAARAPGHGGPAGLDVPRGVGR
jgi:hypothetical protein